MIMESEVYVGSELELFAHARNWKRYWGSLVRPHLGDQVLGIGETAKTLATDHKRWVCLEPDRRMAAHIAERISARDVPAICEARVGTIDDIGEQDFSAVLYIDVLEHIRNDREELSKAAERVRPDGRVIVLAPAYQWLYTPFDLAIGHFRRYTLAELRALTPRQLADESGIYLDSVGLFPSLAERFVLKSEMPTTRQIAMWDGAMVPVSRIVDCGSRPLLSNGHVRSRYLASPLNICLQENLCSPRDYCYRELTPRRKLLRKRSTVWSLFERLRFARLLWSCPRRRLSG
jgi:Methyltransferase domain